jgi:hypothetical protein
MKNPNLVLPLVPRQLTPGLASGGLDFGASHHSPPVIESGPLTCPLLNMEPLPVHSYGSSRRIKPGTYVVFAFNVDIISDQFPLESKGRKVVGEFPRKLYLGLVTESHLSLVDDGPESINQLTVNFVTRAVPSPSAPSKFFLTMYPTDDNRVRTPTLRTSILFPYVDCNQWTIKGVKLMAHQVHDSSLEFALEDYYLERFEEKAVVDFNMLEDLEDEEIQRDLAELQFPEYPFAAEIWKDVRFGDAGLEPLDFVKEVHTLES